MLSSSRPLSNRPRSWCDPQQLQSRHHLSSESPTGFPFASSSYENLDKEGSTEKMLPRSSTVGSFGAQKKDSLSRLGHAQSFAGHEGRESISPRPASGSSPFVVAKHFPGGKSASWQPHPSRSSEFGATRPKFTSDSNVRKYLPDSGVGSGTRESSYSRMGSGESDGSSVASAASMPTYHGARSLGSESHEVALVSRRPVRDRVGTRDRSFDSSISEPANKNEDGSIIYTQHAPRKARPFGNRSQTVELSQIQHAAYGSPSPRNATAITENKPWKRAFSTSSSVREQAKIFDQKKDLVVPPCGVPVLPSGKDVSHYPVGDYHSASMPSKLYDSYDPDRRPSLPEQVDKNVLYKEQRLKELSALPVRGGLAKRSQSFDTNMGIKSPLFRTEAPSIGKDDMLSTPTAVGRTKPVMSSNPAVISPHSSVMSSNPSVIPTESAKVCKKPSSTATESVLGIHKPLSTSSQSVLGIHKPSFVPIVSKTLPSFSSLLGAPKNKDRTSQHLMDSIKPVDTAKSKSPSPTAAPVKPLASPPWKVHTTHAVSTAVITAPKTITTDSTKSAFKPFIKVKDSPTGNDKVQKPDAIEADTIETVSKHNESTTTVDVKPVAMVTVANGDVSSFKAATGTEDDGIINLKTVVKNENMVAMKSGTATKTPTNLSLTIGSQAKSPLLSSKSPILSPKSPLLSPKSPLLSPKSPLLSPKSPLLSPKSPLLSPKSPLISPKSPLLSPKLPSHSSQSSLSQSSHRSSSTSPRLSPRPLELWASKPSVSPVREYYDPETEESGKPEMKRGISQESIQSAMAVLDDAIAMLNSVAMDKTTDTLVTMVTAVPVVMMMTDVGAPVIDLSRSGLLKYSGDAGVGKMTVTSRYASMPLTAASIPSRGGTLPGSGALSDIVAPSQSTVPRSQPIKEVTQLVSSVKTVMCSAQQSLRKLPTVSEHSSVQTLVTSVPSEPLIPEPSRPQSDVTEPPVPESPVPESPILESSPLDSTHGETGEGSKDTTSSSNHSNNHLTHSNHTLTVGNHDTHILDISDHSISNHSNHALNSNNPSVTVGDHGNHSLLIGDHGHNRVLVDNHGNHGTDVGVMVADTSPLDQILAAMQEECEPIPSVAKLQSVAKASATHHNSDKTKKHDKPKTVKKEKTFDKDKSLDEIEARRMTLIRDDSFNHRSDSEPDIESMALPRDSVILRHRYHIKEEMSSSSESSSPATPRLSPRAIRRHKKAGSDTSTKDSKPRRHLGIPGSKHRYVPDALLH